MTLFATLSDGREVHAITIGSDQLQATILTYGAIARDIRLSGVTHRLDLAAENFADYEAGLGFFGAIVGPIANRISNARVRLDGMDYELERNEAGQRHLHSGSAGLHRQVWDVAEETADSVTLTVTLPDGHAGLPGNRRITARYAITGADLSLEITATTDATTPMNCASHIYWNLDGAETFAGHQMRVAADHYLPVDAGTCPTGEVAEVAGTDMDFRETRVLTPGAPMLDHNFCLSEAPGPLRDVFWLTGQSGVSLTLATTEPGLQVHDASGATRPGRAFFEGIVVEPQGWPDAPNNRSFPQITLRPGDTYHQQTRWRFSK